MTRPVGTPNKKNTPWADALRVEASGDDHKKLRRLAAKTFEMALEGDMAAIKEIGDRLDGKAAQAIEHSGDGAGMAAFIRIWEMISEQVGKPELGTSVEAEREQSTSVRH